MCEAAALARDNKASDVDLAITTRQSVRTFRPDPVDRATVEEILALASRSPSGSNIQPWKVRVLADEPRAKLTQAILGAIASDGHEGSRREWNCADLSASVNRLETERASVTEFITFHSF
jgi:nitroreductase